MNPEQIKKLSDAEQKFCNQMLINHAKEVFLLGLFSGGQADSYVITPSHAKGLMNTLASHIESYEKQFGTIDINPSSMPSPFQESDIKNK